MTKPLKIGMIGLDTSHVEAFARLMTDKNDPDYVGGGTIVAAYPGGSPDFDLSINRVETYTQLLRDKYDTTIVDTPEAVAEQSDLIIIHSVDGRVHREQFERIARFGRPVFIDKPFATTSDDARAILEMAEADQVTVMSCSSLRYAEPFAEALRDNSAGNITSVDVWGPLSFQETQPGYLWYGVHAFEMMVAAMGVGCQYANVAIQSQAEIVSCQWDDGRTATYRGLMTGPGTFGAVIHRENGVQVVDVAQTKRPYYAGLLEMIFSHLPFGRSAIASDEMVEVIRTIEIANEAREAAAVTQTTA